MMYGVWIEGCIELGRNDYHLPSDTLTVFAVPVLAARGEIFFVLDLIPACWHNTILVLGLIVII